MQRSATTTPQTAVGDPWSEWASAATITVVTGSPRWDHVLREFQVDPLPVLGIELFPRTDYGELVLADVAGGVMLIVEPNGVFGITPQVLSTITGEGRRGAAWFFNRNGATCLSLAESGTVLACFEPGRDPTPTGPALRPIWAGLDFGLHGNIRDQAFTAIARFTGWTWTGEVYRALHTSGAAYLPAAASA